MTWNTFGGNSKGLYIFPDGDYLTMSDGSNGAHILDLTFPWIPTWLTSLSYENSVAVDVSGEGDYGVCSFVNSHIETFNIPGNTMDSLFIGWMCQSVYTTDGYTYVCQADSGLNIVNTQNPNSISLVDKLYSPEQPFKVTVLNNIAYVASSIGGVSVLDVSNPSSPQLIESLTEVELAKDVAVTPDGSYLYAADLFLGLHVFDLTDPQHPELLNTIAAIPDTGAHTIVIEGDALYLAVWDIGYNAFDITDPENPTLFDYCTDTTKYFREIAISEDGEHMYACAQSEGLLIYSLYPLDSVVYEYTIEYFENPRDIAINGDYAYVADWDNGLFVLDISNYAYVFKVDSLPAQDAISGVDIIEDGLLAVCDWTAGVAVVDISDPLDISEIDRHETPCLAANLFSDGSLLFVCDYYDFIIFDLYGTGVSNQEPFIPIPKERAVLHPAYPNPFNDAATISFDIFTREKVKLSIYNIAGEEVAVLVDSYCEPGSYTNHFAAENLASGVYFAALQYGTDKQIQKMLLIK